MTKLRYNYFLMYELPNILPSFFLSEKQQKAFEQNGYVCIDFYNSREIQLLNDFLKTIDEIPKSGFFPTTYIQDNNSRKAIHDTIVMLSNDAINRVFSNIKIVHGSFIIKQADKTSELGLHQDMTLVDESKFAGVNIWTPLIDLNEKNGAIYVLPKSHKIFATYRASTIPNIYDKYTNFIRKYLVPVYAKAGQAVIFNQAIIHYSPPNLSNSIRPVTNIYITQKDAVFRTYYHNQNKTDKVVEAFKQADNFMETYLQFGYNIYDRPTIGEFIGEKKYNFPVLTPKIMKQHYGINKRLSLKEKLLTYLV